MKERKLLLNYQEYPDISDLTVKDRNLLEMAKTILPKAYAPYSEFLVGAALRTDNDEIIFGANQENASFPLSICAERVALFNKSMNYPDASISAIAVVVKNLNKHINIPGTPCGACRQVMREYEMRQKSPFRVLLLGESGPVFIFDSVKDLLPFSFDGSFL
jgi:cytidine deaminase